MKLAPGTPLDVALAFDPDAPVPAGRLAWAQQTAQLEWSREMAILYLTYPGQNIESPEDSRPRLNTARSYTEPKLHLSY